MARHLTGTLQEQLQQATNREVRQADEARTAQQEATARELHLTYEARERERRQFVDARQLQEDARKAQEAANDRELQRVRQADRREDRLFDHFRDCMEKTRAERTQPTEVAPPTVSKYFASASEAVTGTQPPLSHRCDTTSHPRLPNLMLNRVVLQLPLGLLLTLLQVLLVLKPLSHRSLSWSPL